MYGAQVEVDPDVLVANAPLWRLVDAGVRSSLAQGSLRRGASALAQMSRRFDEETARAVFRGSGLPADGDQP
ncbi:hypothetical protein [Streptomyces sp. NPDC096132]|uniref:hypothetical protein n=1 Tax=Streptomyces sp. NPDC096132 TaxID=3366075 RepID=UPI0038252859